MKRPALTADSTSKVLLVGPRKSSRRELAQAYGSVNVTRQHAELAPVEHERSGRLPQPPKREAHAVVLLLRDEGIAALACAASVFARRALRASRPRWRRAFARRAFARRALRGLAGRSSAEQPNWLGYFAASRSFTRARLAPDRRVSRAKIRELSRPVARNGSKYRSKPLF